MSNVVETTENKLPSSLSLVTVIKQMIDIVHMAVKYLQLYCYLRVKSTREKQCFVLINEVNCLVAKGPNSAAFYSLFSTIHM